ncbi:uncharacterized protein GIQ15_06027 [Arthroderma uncinatum]|uniref:uncharacterized protein n=1 Tax=Arthroderma uncinatum TaxID=74035 RepID=UPI00144A9C4D|nr:uncharacterized protein GIQ15_06027 [Arthroderma uncinatum]KAF3480680.1 hypothetical protein GIQ15_06027 [Arthroderma uncinatum]
MRPHVSTEGDIERALRIRENKRRSRARQKEYNAGLEERLRQLQKEGIQATVEVQAAARKVAEENRHLRELCCHIGLSQQTVEEWLKERRRAETEKLDLRQQRHGTDIPSMGGNPMNQDDNSSVRVRRNTDQHLEASPSTFPGSHSSPEHRKKGTLYLEDVNRPPNESAMSMASSSSANSLSPSTGHLSACNSEKHRSCQQGRAGKSQQTEPPCKLLTRLAANPSTDITQVPIASDDEQDPDKVEDGIPCARAYQLLMHYATSEEKLDTVAQVLEMGCTPNASRNGGCKVKSAVISQTLLDLCL